MRRERDDPARDPAWLFDMLTAAQAVVSFTAGRTFEQYTSDLMFRSAVERQVEIIGHVNGRDAPDQGVVDLTRGAGSASRRPTADHWPPFPRRVPAMPFLRNEFGQVIRKDGSVVERAGKGRSPGAGRRTTVLGDGKVSHLKVDKILGGAGPLREEYERLVEDPRVERTSAGLADLRTHPRLPLFGEGAIGADRNQLAQPQIRVLLPSVSEEIQDFFIRNGSRGLNPSNMAGSNIRIARGGAVAMRP